MRFFLFLLLALLLAHTACYEREGRKSGLRRGDLSARITAVANGGCTENAPDDVPIIYKNPSRAPTTCSQIQAKFEQKKALKNAAEDELDFIMGGGNKNKKDKKKEEKLKQKKEKVRANE